MQRYSSGAALSRDKIYHFRMDTVWQKSLTQHSVFVRQKGKVVRQRCQGLKSRRRDNPCGFFITAGYWQYVSALEAAVAAGADGIMVEVHPRPEEALGDGGQSLKPQ
jgi:hypothetical protein